MSTQFKPLADRVLIEPAPIETKTASGIIIPDSAKEKPLQGKVLAAGSGKVDEPMTLKVGDQVLFGQYSGTEIIIEGEKLLIMRESDVYGIL
ncbi:MAG: chaperonin GroES [Flavobacteriaceae bacterium]|jgi:chaperonin GroES